jgi:signal transduction histidine kinase
LEIVSQKTRSITRLVEDVISLQKMESGNLRFEVVAPHELIASATSGATASAAEYKIDIVSDSPPDLPPIRVDVDRIGQVFDNLVGNAIKFSPTDGKISISAERNENYIKFSVQDHGVGIPADKVEKVFERFYQVDGSTTRRYGGTGLGLAIVKQIVEAHGGQVTVESEANKSTTFSFFLPIFKGEVNYEAA